MITDFNSACRHAGYALSEREQEIAMCFWNLSRWRKIGDPLSGGPVLPFSEALQYISIALINQQPDLTHKIRPEKVEELCAEEARRLIFAYLSSGASKEGSSSPGSSGDSGLVSMSKTGRDGLCDQRPFRRPCELDPISLPYVGPHCESPGASSASSSSCIDAGESNLSSPHA